MAKVGNIDRCFSLPRGVFLDCYNLYPQSKLNIKVETENTENTTGVKTELHFQAVDENTILLLIKESDKDIQITNGSEQTDSSGIAKLISIDSYKVKKEVEDGSDIEATGAILGGICTELGTINTSEKTEEGNSSQGPIEHKEFVSESFNDNINAVISNDFIESDGEKMEMDNSFSSDDTVVITKNDQDRSKKSKKIVKRKATTESINSTKSKSIPCGVKKTKSQKSDDSMKKEKPFHCDHCSKCFQMEYSLYKHVKDDHNMSLAYLDDVQDADTSLKCPYCNDMFMSFNSLKYHINYEHSSKEHDSYIHKCTLCDTVFKTTPNLLAHIGLVHNLTTRKFLCHLCGFAFKRDCNRKEHVQNVHGNPGEVELKCEVCSYTTPSKKYLTAHMRRIHGPKNYMCTYCSRQFKQRRDLNRHILSIHETHKIVKETCEVCGRQFKSKGTLNVHLRSHCKSSGKADNESELNVVPLDFLNYAKL